PRADIDLPMTSGSMQAIAADVNGDGLPDLVVAYGEDGQARGKVVVLINRGHRTFAAPVTYSGYLDPVRVIAADLTDDGKADLVVSDYKKVVVSLNQGDGTFLQPVYSFIPRDW